MPKIQTVGITMSDLISNYSSMLGTSGAAALTSGLNLGSTASKAASLQKESAEFAALLDSLSSAGNRSENAKTVAGGTINGDYTSGFGGAFTSEADKAATPTGAAANSGMVASGSTKIDKTSKLYEKALDLENYFVKIMLSSMRSTIGGSSLTGEKSYATSMYEDMMYDELSQVMTKQAGFGLADQIYLQLM